MKLSTQLLVLLLTWLGATANAFSQATPAPRYIKKAIFVRIHYDQSFYNRWVGTNVNTLLEGYFNEVRTQYLNNAELHNIDLILLNDFERLTGPMMNYMDPNQHILANSATGEIGGNGRLIKYMRDNLSTGEITKRTVQTTYVLGRTINWVFVHEAAGGLKGQANGTPALNSADANVFVTTSSGGYTVNGVLRPFQDQARSVIIETIAHETGHLLGGRHEVAKGCGAQAGFGGELMCPGHTRLDFRFGTQNFNPTLDVVKVALKRCNNAFSNFSACDSLAAAQCSRMDPTQIPTCYESKLLSMCSDLCGNPDTGARRIINTLPAIINGAP